MHHKTPIKLYVRRNGQMETCHDTHAIVMDDKGAAIDTWGDMNQQICPRSSFKLIQALGLAEYQVTDRLDYLSFACASHNAEALHCDTATAWLNDMGLSDSDLQCGGHWPMNRDAEHDLVRQRQKFNALHNNCSGKHTGMLAFCQHMGWPIEHYLSPDHPLQCWIRQTLSALSDVAEKDMAMVIDGCAAPNYFMPLRNIALIFSRFISGQNMSQERAKGCALLIKAIAQHPDLIAGTDRFCTDIARISHGRLIGKTGALGSYVLLAPADKKVFFVKVADGYGAAAPVVLCQLLKRYDIWEDTWQTALQKYETPVIKNCRETKVGDMIVSMPDAG